MAQFQPYANHPTFQPSFTTSSASTTGTTSIVDTLSIQPSAAAPTTTIEPISAETTTIKTHTTLSGSQITSLDSSATPTDFASTANTLSGLSATSTSKTLSSPVQAPTSSTQGSQSASGSIPLGQSYDGGSGSGISSGAIAAAAIVPIVIIAFLLSSFFVLRRRRRRVGPGAPAMRERSTDNANGAATPFVIPFMTSSTNNAYYTGLDGSSEREHSGEFYAPGHSDSSSFVEPPPPYKAKTHDPSGGPIQASAIGAIPIVRLPTGMPYDLPSPDSWATAHDAAFLDTGSAFTRSTSPAGTERSINSDAYSDNPSVHSAHAARRSLGGANVISEAHALQSDFNPFDDPQSPVSSVDGDGVQSLHNSIPDRAISRVSYR